MRHKVGGGGLFLAVAVCLVVWAISINQGGTTSVVVTKGGPQIVPPTLATTPPSSLVPVPSSSVPCLSIPVEAEEQVGFGCEPSPIRDSATTTTLPSIQPSTQINLGATRLRSVDTCSGSSYSRSVAVTLSGSSASFDQNCYYAEPGATITFTDNAINQMTGLFEPTELGISSAKNPASSLLAAPGIPQVVFNINHELFIGSYAIDSSPTMFLIPDLPAGTYLIDAVNIPGYPESVLQVGGA